MKQLLLKILWLFSSLMAFFFSALSDATPHNRSTMVGIQYAQAKEISKSQAVAIAEQRYGGKVIKVTRSGDNYRVRLLLDKGKVKTVTISAKPSKG